MSHLTNEIVTQVATVASLGVVSDKAVSGVASISSGSGTAGSRDAAAPASTKDFGRVRIGGCCIRY